jgi:iron complex transport system substrate-binding protein
MRKLWFVLLAILLCAGAGFLLHGAWQARRPDEAVPPTEADRIVSLAPNLTEILFALGLEDKVVAVSSDSDYPPAATAKTRVGTFWQPNIEAIIASKPDLIMTLWFQQQEAVAESLRRLGYRVVTLRIQTIPELLSAIEQFGAATGTAQRADELVRSMSEKIDHWRRTGHTTDPVKALWVVQTQPLRVAGTDTFINKLLELAGGENAIGPTLQQYPPISSEELLACGAEVIFQSAMSNQNIAAQQKAAEEFWKKWPSLPAVRNDRIHVVEGDTVLRLGTRLCRGIELIAHHLHPDASGQAAKSK